MMDMKRMDHVHANLQESARERVFLALESAKQQRGHADIKTRDYHVLSNYVLAFSAELARRNRRDDDR